MTKISWKTIKLFFLLFLSSIKARSLANDKASEEQVEEASNFLAKQADRADLNTSIGRAIQILADTVKKSYGELEVRQVEKITGKKQQDPDDDIYANGPMGRTSVAVKDPLNLEPLFGYGCWCFFGRIDSNLGRGPPVDEYDSVCQKLSLCYRCIFVDSENEGDDECDPFTVEFDATLDLNALFNGNGLQNATTSCRTDNQSKCSWRTCSCAMTMISSFFNLSFDSQNVYDDNLRHKNGFDYNLECPMQGKSEDRQCCGYYPNRRTYDRKSSRDCCHEKSIFNPLRHVCCADGTHVGLGTQCAG